MAQSVGETSSVQLKSRGRKPSVAVPVGGYPDEMFIGLSESEKEEYMCNICLMLIRGGVQCKRGHQYCKGCIQQWNITSTKYKTKPSKCPTCRKLGTYNISPKNVTLRLQLVTCLAENCSWVGSLADYERHISLGSCPTVAATSAPGAMDLDIQKVSDTEETCPTVKNDSRSVSSEISSPDGNCTSGSASKKSSKSATTRRTSQSSTTDTPSRKRTATTTTKTSKTATSIVGHIRTTTATTTTTTTTSGTDSQRTRGTADDASSDNNTNVILRRSSRLAGGNAGSSGSSGSDGGNGSIPAATGPRRSGRIAERNSSVTAGAATAAGAAAAPTAAAPATGAAATSRAEPEGQSVNSSHVSSSTPTTTRKRRAVNTASGDVDTAGSDSKRKRRN